MHQSNIGILFRNPKRNARTSASCSVDNNASMRSVEDKRTIHKTNISIQNLTDITCKELMVTE